MKMLSLRCLASLAILILLPAYLSAPALAADTDDVKAGEPAAQAADEGTEKKSDKKKDKADKKSKKAAADGEKDKKGKEEGSAEAQSSAQPEAANSAAVERARLLKTMSTPFNMQGGSIPSNDTDLSPLSLPSGGSPLRNSLLSRLGANRVYFPSTVLIGKPAEFVVKARPGSQVAMAMADKDSGAKPLGRINLRLGADRKLVAAGTVPPTGILTLIVDVPIQGDLIGLPLFFETVVWQKPDFSDVELAAPVRSESQGELADKANAIMVAGEKPQKRGVRFESSVPLSQQDSNSLDSGRP